MKTTDDCKQFLTNHFHKFAPHHAQYMPVVPTLNSNKWKRTNKWSVLSNCPFIEDPTDEPDVPYFYYNQTNNQHTVDYIPATYIVSVRSFEYISLIQEFFCNFNDRSSFLVLEDINGNLYVGENECD